MSDGPILERHPRETEAEFRHRLTYFRHVVMTRKPVTARQWRWLNTGHPKAREAVWGDAGVVDLTTP